MDSDESDIIFDTNNSDIDPEFVPENSSPETPQIKRRKLGKKGAKNKKKNIKASKKKSLLHEKNFVSQNYNQFFKNIENVESGELNSNVEKIAIDLDENSKSSIENSNVENAAINLDENSRSSVDINVGNDAIDSDENLKENTKTRNEDNINAAINEFRSKMDEQVFEIKTLMGDFKKRIIKLELHMKFKKSSEDEEFNNESDNENYLTALQSLGFPIDSKSKLDQIEIKLSNEEYKSNLVRS